MERKHRSLNGVYATLAGTKKITPEQNRLLLSMMHKSLCFQCGMPCIKIGNETQMHLNNFDRVCTINRGNPVTDINHKEAKVILTMMNDGHETIHIAHAINSTCKVVKDFITEFKTDRKKCDKRFEMVGTIRKDAIKNVYDLAVNYDVPYGIISERFTMPIKTVMAIAESKRFLSITGYKNVNERLL